MNNKTETVEINLNEFSKDHLILIITYAHEKKLTFNELIVQILTNYVSKQNAENKDQLQLF